MTYRKWGTTERWENGSRIVVSEHGIAEEGDTFECFPGEPGEAPLLPARNLEMLANQVLAVVPGEVAVERLILTHGSANHECEGRRWSDQTFRLHVSLARASGAVCAHGTRARLDLASLDFALVETLAQALLRLEPEREAPPRLRLAPNVAAAVLPSLVGLVPRMSGSSRQPEGSTARASRLKKRRASGRTGTGPATASVPCVCR
jgi:hypothetical protein